ncbi:MAG: GNAT family N-acetyltransferase [Bacillota bacterium]|nr:GNAT family N-acetyltransferase [Bacillota bacterium]
MGAPPFAGPPRRRVLTTRHGPVVVHGPATVDDLAPLRPDPGLTAFRPPAKQKEALLALAEADDGAVFLAQQDDLLVGYCTLHPPDPLTTFGAARLPFLIEMGAIEVSSAWRFEGIGRALLETAFDNEALEDYIVISCEYWWHWDLDGLEMEIWTYRNMLEDVMGRVGLVPHSTDDPEISSHPANMLTARFGRRVSEEQIAAFERVCHSERPWLA